MGKKERWPRDEVLYNKVQESEFQHFFNFARFIAGKVCKEKKMRNMIVCLLVWHKFPSLSVRRARSLLLVFRDAKLIYVDIPCFKTLSNYRAENTLQRVLDALIEESSKPLAKIEHDFATDATGIKTKLFSSWYSLRAKKRIRKRDHLLVHASIGVKSKIVAALNVETEQGKDNVFLREHVDATAKNFAIWQWSGDGMYWCKKNCRKVAAVGGTPYFKCRTGKTAWNGKQGGHPAWKEMNTEAQEQPEWYDKQYHKRSNIEAGNHSKKALHGEKAYSKLDSARKNEETLRWINHNQTVLNRARHEWNIHAKFMD